MPYEIRTEPGGVHKRFWGHVTGEELIASSLDLHASPAFEALSYSINDFLEVETYRVDDMDIRLVTGFTIDASHANARIVIAILTRDPQVRALVEPFRRRIQPSYPVGIFSDLDDARSWVQIQQQRLKPIPPPELRV
jgi:hypothetical protein